MFSLILMCTTWVHGRGKPTNAIGTSSPPWSSWRRAPTVPCRTAPLGHSSCSTRGIYNSHFPLLTLLRFVLSLPLTDRCSHLPHKPPHPATTTTRPTSTAPRTPRSTPSLWPSTTTSGGTTACPSTFHAAATHAITPTPRPGHRNPRTVPTERKAIEMRARSGGGTQTSSGSSSSIHSSSALLGFLTL